MKKQLLSLVLMALPMMANAYDAYVDGLYFNLDVNSQTAEVTKGDYKQVGAISIPETITVDAITYIVTTIGDEAFDMCQNLNKVTIPSTVTRIGKFAFYQCLEMTSVNIPSSVTDIDEQAFRYCWKLTTIGLPNSVTKISDGVFMDCESLEAITIPSTITSIGESAFRRCSNLTVIVIPDGVTSIGTLAFLDCNRLSSIYLPESIISVGVDAFKDTPWYNNQPDGLMYIGKVAYKYKGTMPNSTTVDLQDGTAEISGQAFLDCQGLVSIKIPESVKSIGEGAFRGCTNLCTVNIPSSVKEITGGCFYDCQSLYEIKLPYGLQVIGPYAFQNSGLTSIEFPETLSEIENDAFSYCNGLETIQIPASVVKIGDNAFYNRKLKHISIATGNTVYDSRNDCNAIIETATNTLLYGCQSSFVPNGIAKIGNHAFVGCEELTSIIIPSSVKSIGEFAFDTCPSLASVTLNEGLESIGKQAFCRCCALDAITLPLTLNEIGPFAFSATNLTNITTMIEEPFAIDASVFQNIYSKATLYVPTGTKSKYENTENWNQFANIVEISKQCEKPIIAYDKGRLKFECTTEGAIFLTSISDTDVRSHVGSDIELMVTYTINVIATAIGYKNSEVAIATLCWIDADPKTEGIENGIAQVRANAVLIQNYDGTLNITGVADGSDIAVYSVSGIKVGSAKACGNTSSIVTNLKRGEIAIVQIGDKSVKVIMQ